MRNWYGFTLSLTTAVMWGVLPVFLKLCLQVTDSSTITWYRFTFAAGFVFLVLWYRNALPRLSRLPVKKRFLLIAAAIALVVNYVANVEGLEYVDPETVQIVMQLAPFLLMLGGIFLFGERLSRLELSGVVLLLTGLMFFFSPRLGLLLSALNDYSVGVLIVILAAVTWAAYALAQKVLLRHLTAKQLTLMIYAMGGLMLLPFANLPEIVQMNGLQWFALVFACFNTIIAYGAFTEALHVWQAAKVSAVIALSPVFTFISMEMAVRWLPEHFVASDLDFGSYLGAAMVVTGSIVTALGKGSTTGKVQ